MATGDFINAGQFTIGPNNSVSIFESATNNEVDWGLLTEINWESSTVTERRPVSLMSGSKLDLIFDQGWKGSLSIQRTTNKLDLYWSAFEAVIRAGVVRPVFTIIQRINETDGSISQYTFYECGVTYDSAGTYANEEGVVQVVSFTSPAREAKLL